MLIAMCLRLLTIYQNFRQVSVLTCRIIKRTITMRTLDCGKFVYDISSVKVEYCSGA